MEKYYLVHHGIKGQKWGVRRYQNKNGSLTNAGKKRYSDSSKSYHSTGLKSAIAKHQNKKVDKSFKKWKENSEKKQNAVALGKKMNHNKMIYETNRTKENKDAYSSSKKSYKKALKSNTTYRKGAIRGEVGKDASRKYLSSAKQVKKKLDSDPTNKELKKQYNSLMSKHAVERAKARIAPEVGATRSRKKAAIKRKVTMATKAAALTGSVSAGLYFTNKYILKGKFNGDINSEKVVNYIKTAKKFMKYLY